MLLKIIFRFYYKKIKAEIITIYYIRMSAKKSVEIECSFQIETLNSI